MKKIFTIILMILSIPFEIYSQNGLTAHAVPPGTGNTRYRNDLKVDASDNVWVAFQDIGIGKFNGSNWTVYNNGNSSFPDTITYAIAFDNMSNVWAGTHHGLAKFNGTSWNVFNTSNSGLPGNIVKAVAAAGNTIWTGTTSGAAFYDGTNWTTYNTLNSGILSDTVNAFAFGANGEIWIGTFLGLSKFYQNVWTDYPSQSVLSLAVDNNNDVWIGTLINSIYKLENGVVKDYATQIYNGTIPFASYSAYALVKSPQGNIVMSQVGGICEIAPQIVNYYWYRKSIGYASFGTRNDFDSSGKLWFVTRRATVSTPFGSDSIFSFDFSQYGNYGYALTNDNFKYLDVNDVKASMMDFGMMHWDINSYLPKYEVPKGSGKNSVYASALWIGGLDAGNNLHAAAQTYRQTGGGGGNDYWPGPLDTLTGAADSIATRPYDKIWKVNRFDVENFKYNFLLGNVTNGTYQIPWDILTWPASGTGSLSRNLAPYVDYNSDGSYDPFDGDYPLIKGDQMLYWIFNDNLAVHEETDALPLGFEIQTSAYAYTCPSLSDSNFVMNWTTLYNYKIINRTSVTYHDIYIGLWSDMDLGFYQDDYVGCDSALDIGFTYNGDNNDDLPDGYGLNPPMQNILVLKGPLADAGDGLDNNHNGTIDEPGERCMMNHFLYYDNNNNPANGNPSTGLDFYNYLQSRYLNGTNVLDCNANTTNYMFNGEPYSGTGCTEAGFGNIPNDRRFLMSSGPITIAPGGETSIDFAYVFTWDSTAPNGFTTSVAKNIAGVQQVKHWFDTDNFPSCLLLNVGVDQPLEENNFFSIYPNPAHDKLFVQLSGSFKLSESSYEVIDLLGRIYSNGKLNSNYIDTRQLSEGFYILQLHDGKNMYRKKFVKQ